MSYETNAKWFETVFPHADRVHRETGVFTSVVLAHWALETGYGTSGSFKEGNNIGGIKNVGQPQANGTLYGHAKYATVDRAVDDYIRVMNLSYLSAMRSASSPEEAIWRLDESPYAEDPQQGAKLLSIFNTYGLRGYDTWQGGGSAQPNPFSDIMGKVGNLSNEEMQKMAGIGLVVVALMALVKA